MPAIRINSRTPASSFRSHSPKENSTAGTFVSTPRRSTDSTDSFRSDTHARSTSRRRSAVCSSTLPRSTPSPAVRSSSITIRNCRRRRSSSIRSAAHGSRRTFATTPVSSAAMIRKRSPPIPTTRSLCRTSRSTRELSSIRIASSRLRSPISPSASTRPGCVSRPIY